VRLDVLFTMRETRIVNNTSASVNSISIAICESSTPATDMDFNDVLENIRLLLEYIKKASKYKVEMLFRVEGSVLVWVCLTRLVSVSV